MKFVEEFTYGTTAHGGQTITTTRVPKFNRFEQHVLDRNKHKGKSSAKFIKAVTFAAKHPYFCISMLAIIVILLIYVVSSADAELDRVIEAYESVGNNITNSKGGFDKKLFFISVDANGNKTVTIGFKSEVEQQQAEQADIDAGISDGTDAGNSSGTAVSNIVVAGPVTTVAAANVSTHGHVISGITIGGKKVYDGIPEQWNATSNSKYIDFKKTVESWKEWYKNSFGHEYPNSIVTSGYHADDYLNKHSTAGKNGSLTYNGVDCMGFAPSEYYGNLTFKQSNGSQLSSAYNYMYCIVLKNTVSGDYVFMPAIATDAKAHTWPGAVCQTYTKFTGNQYLYCQTSENGNSTTDVSEMISILESGNAGKVFGATKDTTVQMNLEVYKMADALRSSGFKAVGVIRVE